MSKEQIKLDYKEKI